MQTKVHYRRRFTFQKQFDSCFTAILIDKRCTLFNRASYSHSNKCITISFFSNCKYSKLRAAIHGKHSCKNVTYSKLSSLKLDSAWFKPLTFASSTRSLHRISSLSSVWWATKSERKEGWRSGRRTHASSLWLIVIIIFIKFKNIIIVKNVFFHGNTWRRIVVEN